MMLTLQELYQRKGTFVVYPFPGERELYRLVAAMVFTDRGVAFADIGWSTNDSGHRFISLAYYRLWVRCLCIKPHSRSMGSRWGLISTHTKPKLRPADAR